MSYLRIKFVDNLVHIYRDEYLATTIYARDLWRKKRRNEKNNNNNNKLQITYIKGEFIYKVRRLVDGRRSSLSEQ